MAAAPGEAPVSLRALLHSGDPDSQGSGHAGPRVVSGTIAVLGGKGGEGRTTLALALGLLLASQATRPLVTEVPARGTLAYRARCPQTAATTEQIALTGDTDRIWRTDGGLAVLPAPAHADASPDPDADPDAESGAGSDTHVQAMAATGATHPLTITDCVAGLHPATVAAIDEADLLVIAMNARSDSAAAAGSVLDWLRRTGRGHALARALLVITGARPGDPGLNIAQVTALVGPHVAQVLSVPWDAHLAAGAPLELDRLWPATRQALLDLASAATQQLTLPSQQGADQ